MRSIFNDRGNSTGSIITKIIINKKIYEEKSNPRYKEVHTIYAQR
jgi:hypothetical protein